MVEKTAELLGNGQELDVEAVIQSIADKESWWLRWLQKVNGFGQQG